MAAASFRPATETDVGPLLGFMPPCTGRTGRLLMTKRLPAEPVDR
jgi:hypothetical protein